MSRPRLVVISGPSGSGKTTLIQGLIQDRRCRLAVSATTRPPRTDERDGVAYHFVDRATFERMRDEGALLEWAEVHGDLYGTPRAEADRRSEGEHCVLLDIDCQGWESVRRAGLDALGIFISPPSEEVLEQRLRGRGTESEERIQVRLRNAAVEMAARDSYDHDVVNLEVDESIRALRDLLGLTTEAGSTRGQATP